MSSAKYISEPTDSPSAQGSFYHLILADVISFVIERMKTHINVNIYYIGIKIYKAMTKIRRTQKIVTIFTKIRLHLCMSMHYICRS